MRSGSRNCSDVLFVVVGDLSFGRRNLCGEIAVGQLDVAQSDLFVGKIVGVARFVVAHLHAVVDHVAQRVRDHAIALGVFVFSRQQIVRAEHVLVSVEVELTVALKSGFLGDFILQRHVADADAEMARLVADQLFLDQPLDGFLANIDVLEHGLRIGAVHLLHGRAQLVGLAIDLIAKYLLAVDGRDRDGCCRTIQLPKAPKSHDNRQDGERYLHLPRVLVTSNSF